VRLVAVADTHLYHDELVVPEGDVFVHAGDLCRAGEPGELEAAARWIRALPHPTKIVVAGNHDIAFESQPERAREILGPEVVYLEEAGTRVEGLKFWGSPWQPEFNHWAFNLPRGAALAEKWALIPEDVDVLVTHGPPFGIGDRGPTAGRLGCEELLARVTKVRPLVHLFGHIHQDGGVWQREETCFANVTTWECERGATVLEIDALTRVVTPVSVPSRR